MLSLEWNKHRDGCPIVREFCAAVELDGSAAFFQQLPGNPEPNSCTALALGGEERLEHAINIFAADPGAFIRDDNLHALVANFVRLDGQHASVWHGIDGIEDEIGEDLH